MPNRPSQLIHLTTIASTPEAAVEWLPLLIGLFGGLALFLFGMEQMADALKAAAGERMRSVLAQLTSNRLMGVLTGAFVTAVIQSSSVTTVLVVGFISAGLMSLSQSVGVIMGANIGTTITAQIIAFDVDKYALLMIAAGYGLVALGRSQARRQLGAVLLGLGLIFFGMALMGEAMAPLRSYPPFLDAMARMESPILGILAAALFTALVQSSSATTGIVIVMAGQGLISLPAGIALIFGSNVGTCITALLATFGKPREALRAACVHVLFNVAGVLVWVSFIEQLASLVAVLSPPAGDTATSERLAAAVPRQIANAHTIFNVFNTLLFIGLAPRIARLVERLVPDLPAGRAPARPRYLDSVLIATPALALDRVRLELLHMGNRVQEMLIATFPAVLFGDRRTLEEVAAMDEAIDSLHGSIVSYLGKLSQGQLTEAQTHDLIKLLEAANNLENIGDILETNLVGLGRRRLEKGVVVSKATQEVIREFHATVGRALEMALLAVTEKNKEAAQAVIDMKAEINRLADAAARHGARRLVADEPRRLPSYAIEMDVLENLKRVYYFTKRISRSIVPSTERTTSR